MTDSSESNRPAQETAAGTSSMGGDRHNTATGRVEDAAANTPPGVPAGVTGVNPADAVKWDFVLATDLDGTFLGGTDADRKALYDWIDGLRPHVGLIFVTGRDPAFILQSCIAGLMPWPDYVVGDVGTTIARIHRAESRFEIIAALEAEIAARWGDRGDFVRETLAAAPGLSVQQTPFRYRVSYHYDPATHDPASTRELEAAGLDILISHDCYLDVLPGGISKGPSLLRLLQHLGVPDDRVLVAGDTLNDLSMFETGLHGAVVGGSEPGLLAATAGLPKSRHCAALGAGGIIEAIRAFGLHPTPPEPGSPPPAPGAAQWSWNHSADAKPKAPATADALGTDTLGGAS